MGGGYFKSVKVVDKPVRLKNDIDVTRSISVEIIEYRLVKCSIGQASFTQVAAGNGLGNSFEFQSSLATACSTSCWLSLCCEITS